MQNFRNLQVWRSAHTLVLSVYRITRAFPREEQFTLVSQIRRAAISVPANIAEGCGRGSDRDFARHLQIAVGSADELDYHLLLATDLCFISSGEHQLLLRELVEVRKMLTGLVRRLKSTVRSS